MIKSTFRKELSATGKNGVIAAEVVVTMDYSTKVITGHHPSTHDDFTRQVPIHKVESFVNGSLWVNKMGLQYESEVLQETERILKEVRDYIDRLANEEPIITFTDKMKELLN